MNMITCREVLDFLADYHDGQLPHHIQVVFEAHLSICPDCVSYLHNYRETIRLTKLSCHEDAPQLPDSLVKAILAARQS